MLSETLPRTGTAFGTFSIFLHPPDGCKSIIVLGAEKSSAGAEQAVLDGGGALSVLRFNGQIRFFFHLASCLKGNLFKAVAVLGGCAFGQIRLLIIPLFV